MIEVNVDMGERGYAHPGDLALLLLVNRVNLAVGGHAGDERTAKDFQKRAEDLGLMVSIHPSFPDRENFGRLKMEISDEHLLESLSHQRGVLPDIYSIKFHGALYNLAWTNSEMAECLVKWCRREGLKEILCPPGSQLEIFAKQEGLKVIREGFSDRAYAKTSDGTIMLLPRNVSGSVLSGEAAFAQVQEGFLRGRVPLYGKKNQWYESHWDSWCLHSDSEGAIMFATLLQRWIQAI